MRKLFESRTHVGFVVAAMLAALACGNQAAPTPVPSSDSINRAEIGALIEQTVKAEVGQALISTGEKISREELMEVMAEVVAQRSSNISREEVAELVSNSVTEALAETDPITKAEVEQFIRSELTTLQEAQGTLTVPGNEVSKPTIVFSDLGWVSARLQNRIAMFIVKHGFGYPVDRISGQTQVLWDNLLDGDSLVTMEVWLPNQQEDWKAALFKGAVIPLGKSLDENWQGFVVPTYVTKNRNLEHVYDITDEDNLRIFIKPGTEFERDKRAILVTCPVGTECHDINLAKIKAYNLNRVEFSVPTSISELEASLERAYAAKRPWLGYMWGPSRLSEELDLTILAEPEYSEDCWATTKACAYPTAQVLVAVHPSMLTIAPEVVEFLRKWDFTARRQIQTEKWMSNNDATEDAAAVFFLNTWTPVWTEWVPEDVAQRVLAAIAQEIVSPTFDVAPCRMTRAAPLPIEFEYAGSVPTGFDGINRADCTFTRAVEKVTVVLTGPATHSETFTFIEPTTQVSFPLPDDTLSFSTLEVVPPGKYHRKMTVTSVDGATIVISSQPGVLKSVTILEPQAVPSN